MITSVVLAAVLAAPVSPTPFPTDFEPTDQMIAASTIPLTAADATFELDLAGSIVQPDISEKKQDKTVVTLTSDVLFAFDKADLSAVAKAKIGQLIAKAPNGASVAIDGYTDNVGTDAINLPLSQRRATAVADAVRAARPDLKLQVAGHGAADPVADNKDSAGRAANRRVTMTYTG